LPLLVEPTPTIVLRRDVLGLKQCDSTAFSDQVVQVGDRAAGLPAQRLKVVVGPFRGGGPSCDAQPFLRLYRQPVFSAAFPQEFRI
jgi:hypothetical protein